MEGIMQNFVDHLGTTKAMTKQPLHAVTGRLASCLQHLKDVQAHDIRGMCPKLNMQEVDLFISHLHLLAA